MLSVSIKLNSRNKNYIILLRENLKDYINKGIYYFYG